MTDATEDKIDIGTLRAVAKALKIKAERTWRTEDYLEAIAQQQSARNLPDVVLDENAPKPGYARIIIHRNGDPNGSNSPVHLALNGKFYQVPRGIPVDIEKEFIEVLQHATSRQPVLKQAADNRNPAGIYGDEENMAYPFQVVAITPGSAFNSKLDNRAVKHKYKEDFLAEHDHWPTDGELKEFLKVRTKKG